jgi:hypothetical protein
LYFNAFAREKNALVYRFGSEYPIDRKIYKNQNSYAAGLAAKLL